MQTMPSDRLAAVLLLAAIAGCVDAVGFTELGGYFVSFMSGNSTRLGLHLAYGEFSAALFTFGLVALFVGGAAAGTLILQGRRRYGVSVLLLCEAALLGLAWALLDRQPSAGAVILPVAMGLSNIVAFDRRSERVGVTYFTGTLVRIGVGLASLGRGESARTVLRDIGLWLALIIGVAYGGAGLLRWGGEVLLGPIVILAALALIEAAAGRGERPTVSVPPSGRH